MLVFKQLFTFFKAHCSISSNTCPKLLWILQHLLFETLALMMYTQNFTRVPATFALSNFSSNNICPKLLLVLATVVLSNFCICDICSKFQDLYYHICSKELFVVKGLNYSCFGKMVSNTYVLTAIVGTK